MFVTRAFPLIQQPGADPPHQRMEPKDGLHEHMNRRGQVVVTANMAQFMRHDGFQFRVREMLLQVRRQQQHRTPTSDDGGLQ